MPRCLKIRPAPRRGTAAVELAIVATFLLVPAAYGIMEVTRAIQVKDALTDAARSACRVAVQPGAANSNVTANITAVLAANGIAASLATPTILVNGNAVDVSTAKQGDKISVKVALPVSKVNWVLSHFLAASAVESETLVMMRQG